MTRTYLPTPLTIESMIQALELSGYLVEARVGNTLRDQGYSVFQNTPYPDPLTGKSREHDILAYKQIGAVTVALVIECKNTANPYAFIMQEHSIQVVQNTLKCAYQPTEVLSDDGMNVDLLTFVGLSPENHYTRNARIASQWCTFGWKDKDKNWIANHGRNDSEDSDDSRCPFRRLVDVTEYEMRKQHDWFEQFASIPILQLHFPILLVNSDLYEVQTENGETDLVSSEHIVYRIDLATKDGSLSYFMDVITEKSLPKYLDFVESEVSSAAKIISDEGKRLTGAMERHMSMKEVNAVKHALENSIKEITKRLPRD